MTDQSIAINALEQSVTGSRTITKTVFFNASRETVWSFLTEKDKLAQWFHPADVDLETGKDYKLMTIKDDGTEGCACWGTVLSMDPPSKMVQSFAIHPFAEDSKSTVTWILEEFLDGTRLTLIHEGVAEAMADAPLPIFMALDAGWDSHFGRLRGLLKELG